MRDKIYFWETFDTEIKLTKRINSFVWISLAVSNFGWWIFESNRLHLRFALCWGEQTPLWTNTIFTQRVFSPHWRSPRAPARARDVLLGLGTVPARWSCGERARPGPVPSPPARGPQWRPRRARGHRSGPSPGPAPLPPLSSGFDTSLAGWVRWPRLANRASSVRWFWSPQRLRRERGREVGAGGRGFFCSFFPLKREKGR